MAAALINGLADSNDSSVLGLVGPWGSGKSTVLNYVERQLDKDVHVVKFNPWSFDDERLQAELYSAILEAFPRGSRRSTRIKFLELLRRSSPALKAFAAPGTAMYDTLKEFLPSKSWDTTFEDLSKTIMNARVKLLVIVDDVDRLQPNELLLLIKTIRQLGRFPRVNYLLAYDRKSTIDILGSALGGGPGSAEVYLEKIVQYPLDLPDPQQAYLQEIVNELLGPILESASAGMSGPTPKIRFEEFYREHMWTALNTPRACQRYARQAKTFLSVTGGDVDVADFFALTFLRLFYSDLYKKLPVWSHDLSVVRDGVPQPHSTSASNWLERVKSCGYREDIAHQLVDALSSLFPRAFPDPLTWGMAGGKYRAHDAEYFHRYFTFSLPAGDISDVLVERDLGRILNGDISYGQRCPDTFDHPVEDLRMKALRKGKQHTDYQADTRRLINFLSFGLSHTKGKFGAYVDGSTLEASWMAKLIGSQPQWPQEDVETLVSRFKRPASLGYALKLDHDEAQLVPGSSFMENLDIASSTLPPHARSFAGTLAQLWTKHAMAWLLQEWKSIDSVIPNEELTEVSAYVTALGGQDQLQTAAVGALLNQEISLTALVSKFVVSRHYIGDFRASSSDLWLDIPKLENTLPVDLLLELPLDALGPAPVAYGEGSPSDEQRQQFGIEALNIWRRDKSQYAGDANNNP